ASGQASKQAGGRIEQDREGVKAQPNKTNPHPQNKTEKQYRKQKHAIPSFTNPCFDLRRERGRAGKNKHRAAPKYKKKRHPIVYKTPLLPHDSRASGAVRV
ncbi:unnamed protein product, partial [Laminaria digitata]